MSEGHGSGLWLGSGCQNMSLLLITVLCRTNPSPMQSDFVIMNNLRKAQEVSYDERERGCTIFLSLHALGLVIILCIIYWWWPWNIHVMLIKHIFLCIKEKIKSRWSVYQQFIYSFHRDIRQLNAEKLLQTHMDMYTDSHNSEITQVSL